MLPLPREGNNMRFIMFGLFLGSLLASRKGFGCLILLLLLLFLLAVALKAGLVPTG